jgi:hypothetical protein
MCDRRANKYIKDDTEELRAKLNTMSLSEIRKQAEKYEKTEWPNIWYEEVYTSYVEERRGLTDSEDDNETEGTLIDETDNEGDYEDNGEHGSHNGNEDSSDTEIYI